MTIFFSFPSTFSLYFFYLPFSLLFFFFRLSGLSPIASIFFFHLTSYLAPSLTFSLPLFFSPSSLFFLPLTPFPPSYLSLLLSFSSSSFLPSILFFTSNIPYHPLPIHSIPHTLPPLTLYFLSLLSFLPPFFPSPASVPIAPFPFTQLNTKESRNEYSENGVLDQENGINSNGKLGALHGSHSHLKSGTSHDAKRITNQLILDALSPPLPIPFCPPVALRHDLELLDSVPESLEGGADALLQVSASL